MVPLFLLLFAAACLGTYLLLFRSRRSPRGLAGKLDSLPPGATGQGRVAYEITVGVLALLGSAVLVIMALWTLLSGLLLGLGAFGPGGVGWFPVVGAVGMGLFGVLLGGSARRRLLRI